MKDRRNFERIAEWMVRRGRLILNNDERSKIMRILALGVFDLLHVGHLRYLKQCRAAGTSLLVALCPDALCRDLKGRGPIIPEDERRELVAALACVDDTCFLPCRMAETDLAANWIQSLGIGLVMPGAEWQGRARWTRLAERLSQSNIAISFAHRTSGISSTDIRKRIVASQSDAHG